jgi:hypothetical protein
VSEVLIVQTLPLELKNYNTGRGHAHWQSTKIRKEYESVLRARRLTRQPFDRCVDVVLCRVLGPKQRLWDADSVLRGSAKELIDSLVACGWFHDDGPEWIRRAVGIQDKSQRHNGPAVVIAVEAFDESER